MKLSPEVRRTLKRLAQIAVLTLIVALIAKQYVAPVSYPTHGRLYRSIVNR